MLNDIDTVWQMYATVSGGADRALTLLDTGNVWTAKETLQKALHRAEDLYIAAEQAADELEPFRKT